MCGISKEALVKRTLGIAVGDELVVRNFPALHPDVHVGSVVAGFARKDDISGNCIICAKTGFGMTINMPTSLAEQLAIPVIAPQDDTLTITAKFIEDVDRQDEGRGKYTDALNFGSDEAPILVNFDHRFANANVTAIVDLAPGQIREVKTIKPTIRATPMSLKPLSQRLPATVTTLAAILLVSVTALLNP